MAAKDDAQQARAREAAAKAKEEQQKVSAKDVQALELATADGSTTYCQGGKPPLLKLSLTAKGGRHEGVQGGKGEELFELLQWSTSLGSISKTGGWSFEADSAQAAQQPVVITATVADKPAVTAQLTLAPDFKCERIAHFLGQPGQEGETGSQGAIGQGNSSSQRNGGSGGMGGQGGAGGPGRDGVALRT
jgi:hypothetical protein